ncbi:MAG TPA: anthranilate phosphoribosyltransferase [Acidimicrobiales bacterium]|nr:anthranilate phosphoribosyltransferase [Acidimicrobiales bacterium]
MTPGADQNADAAEDEKFAAIGGWPGVLGRLMSGRDLTGEEAGCVLGTVLSGTATDAQIAALVTGLRIKGETVEEMAGLVRAMLAHAEPLDVPGDLVDTCGTGGDRSGSVNVSTMAAFVVAGAGARVCKHGGRAASSASGSADVLEALGVVIDLGPRGVARCIEEVGMGFCFAPRYHPAMRFAIPVRRELGVATVFNFLGPLANPARPRHQVVGVSDPAMADKMLGVLVANGARRAMVVHGADGLDELSTTAPSSVLQVDLADQADQADQADEADRPNGARHEEGARQPDGTTLHDEVRRYTVDAADLGIASATLDDLRGGDAASNAEVVKRVLGGEVGPHRDVVVLNAAAGLVVAGLAKELADGVGMAGAVLDDGRAQGVLEGLVRVSQEAARADVEPS